MVLTKVTLEDINAALVYIQKEIEALKKRIENMETAGNGIEYDNQETGS